MFVFIRSTAFALCYCCYTQKLVLLRSKNVTAKCTETLSPPPSIQYLLAQAHGFRHSTRSVKAFFFNMGNFCQSLFFRISFLKHNKFKIYNVFSVKLSYSCVKIICFAIHINSVCLKTVSSIFTTGSTLKCRYALGLDFSALTHLYFSVALYLYILSLQSTCC